MKNHGTVKERLARLEAQTSGIHEGLVTVLIYVVAMKLWELMQ